MSFKQRLISSTALIASVGALTAAGATAMPPYPVGPTHDPSAQSVSQPATGQPTRGHVPAATYSRQDKQVTTNSPATPSSGAPVKTPASGFSLADAGIGLGALALAMLAAIGVLAFSRSRSRRTHGRPALTH